MLYVSISFIGSTQSVPSFHVKKEIKDALFAGATASCRSVVNLRHASPQVILAYALASGAVSFGCALSTPHIYKIVKNWKSDRVNQSLNAAVKDLTKEVDSNNGILRLVMQQEHSPCELIYDLVDSFGQGTYPFSFVKSLTEAKKNTINDKICRLNKRKEKALLINNFQISMAEPLIEKARKVVDRLDTINLIFPEIAEYKKESMNKLEKSEKANRLQMVVYI